MNELFKTLNYYKNSREILYIKKELYTEKLKHLQELFLNKNLHQKKYYDTFIKNKNLIEKRKFLSLLLLVSTNLNIEELIHLKVENFLKIIEIINIQLNNYEELPKSASDSDPIYLLIETDAVRLKLNPSFKYFFIEDLYDTFISNKKDEDPVLTSVVTNRPLASTNLKKDLNEEIVELI